MTPFFITGLYRSRTAWLANLFTTDTTICYHDLPFSKELCEREDKRVGFSGAELVFQYNEIHAIYPDARWLVVARDGQAAMDSFIKFSKIPLFPLVVKTDFENRVKLLDSIGKLAPAWKIWYELLDIPVIVKQVWEWLLPDKPFDEERFKLLDELRVEQHWDKAFAKRKDLCPSFQQLA